MQLLDNDLVNVIAIFNENEKIFLFPVKEGQLENWFKKLSDAIQSNKKEKYGTIEVECQTDPPSFLKDQKYISTRKEIENLSSQLKIMNSSFFVSKLEEEKLSIKMSELVKYVDQMKNEENNRLDAIQQRVRSIW
jgi:hypothetical protein